MAKRVARSIKSIVDSRGRVGSRRATKVLIYLVDTPLTFYVNGQVKRLGSLTGGRDGMRLKMPSRLSMRVYEGHRGFDVPGSERSGLRPQVPEARILLEATSFVWITKAVRHDSWKYSISEKLPEEFVSFYLNLGVNDAFCFLD